MSRKLSMALMAALAFASAGLGATAQTTWEAVEGATLTPGVPFVIYAGDQWGNPLILVGAGVAPVPGDPDLVLVLPRTRADLYLWSPDMVWAPEEARTKEQPRLLRDGLDLNKGPSQLQPPGSMTSFTKGGTLVNGTTGHEFVRFGRSPPTQEAPPDLVLPGWSTSFTIGGTLVDDRRVYGYAPSARRWWDHSPGSQGPPPSRRSQDATRGPSSSLDPVGAKLGAGDLRRPPPQLPGALTSLTEGGTLVDGTGRFGRTPPPVGPDILPREGSGLLVMPAPPGSGPALAQGVSVFVSKSRRASITLTAGTR